jgi:GSH-dependent disulfide-bond oxidoreductase
MGRRVHAVREKCALANKAVAVDIGSGGPFRSDFLAINPNIAARVDPDGPDGQSLSRVDSGALVLSLTPAAWADAETLPGAGPIPSPTDS